MRAHRRLDDREHAVRGDADEVRPRPQVVDDPLDGHDRAPPGRRARPTRLRAAAGAARRCPSRSATGACSSATSGCSGASRPTWPNGVSTRGVRVVRLHRRSRDRTRRDRRQPPRRGFEPLREREERPVLDLDLAAFVRAREPRVRREVGERVARVSGDHLAHEAAAEEERAEARQRQHHEREAGIATPALPHDLARRRGPARVADDRMQHVARPHVARDRFAQGRLLVRHRPQASGTRRERPAPSATSCVRCAGSSARELAPRRVRETTRPTPRAPAPIAASPATSPPVNGSDDDELSPGSGTEAVAADSSYAGSVTTVDPPPYGCTGFRTGDAREQHERSRCRQCGHNPSSCPNPGTRPRRDNTSNRPARLHACSQFAARTLPGDSTCPVQSPQNFAAIRGHSNADRRQTRSPWGSAPTARSAACRRPPAARS